MTNLGWISLAMYFLVMGSSATAETGPVRGAVYNLQLKERVSYSCLPTSETELRCEFVSAQIVPVLPPDQKMQRLSEELARIEGPEGIEEMANMSCEILAKFDDLSPADLEDFNLIPEVDRESMLSSLEGVCERRDRAAIEALFAQGIDVQSRTCRIGTFKWTGNFSKSDENTWVRTDKDPPLSDGCAGVYLDRFELSEGGYLWNLVRLNFAANPNGTFTTGEKCSEVYTGQETRYRWQSNDFSAQCDYIRLDIN